MQSTVVSGAFLPEQRYLMLWYNTIIQPDEQFGLHPFIQTLSMQSDLRSKRKVGETHVLVRNMFHMAPYAQASSQLLSMSK